MCGDQIPNLIGLRELPRKWRSEGALTYASENADHYRGFDAGRLRAAEELEVWIDRAEEWAMQGPRQVQFTIAQLFGKKEK